MVKEEKKRQSRIKYVLQFYFWSTNCSWLISMRLNTETQFCKVRQRLASTCKVKCSSVVLYRWLCSSNQKHKIVQKSPGVFPCKTIIQVLPRSLGFIEPPPNFIGKLLRCGIQFSLYLETQPMENYLEFEKSN